MNGPVLRLTDVERSYRMGRDNEVRALRGVSLEVEPGEFVAIVGPSGSGKTTLLNMAGLLDQPDSGEVWIAGRATTGLRERERARLRREAIGFVFQSFNLLPHLTAEENASLPIRYAEPGSKLIPPARLLSRVGLGERLRHRPDELSGGEQQRVAIARALVADPPLILADEPTGDLDSETAAGIIRLMHRLSRVGKSLLVVTHNEELARAASRLVHMRDGRIEEEPAPRRRTATRETRARKPAGEKPSRAKPTAGRREGSG